jgi:integrase
MLENTKRTSIYILPSAKGVQMSKISFRRMMEPIQDKLSFVFTFHQLRHTYATLLEKMKVSPKMCQYLLGHATESTTKKIYTHVQKDYVYATSIEINDILNFSQKSVSGVSRGSKTEGQILQSPVQQA